MATATAPTPIAEAIQVTINHWVHEYEDKLREVVDQMAEPLGWPSADWARALDEGDPGPTPDESPWAVLEGELREAMQLQLAIGIDKAVKAASEAIYNELIVAGFVFALEHPEAPRSTEAE